MNIDFACKSIKIDSIIKCSLGLSIAEMKIFKYFLKHEGEFFSTLELENKLSFELSTIQKGVKKMTSRGVLEKRQKNLERGGYVFEYRIRDKKEVKELIIRIVDAWVEKVGEKFCEW